MSNQIGGTVISVACFDIYNNPLSTVKSFILHIFLVVHHLNLEIYVALLLIQNLPDNLSNAGLGKRGNRRHCYYVPTFGYTTRKWKVNVKSRYFLSL